MKAALLAGLGRVEIRTVPDPPFGGDTDVLVRVGAVGVCGSDIHYYLEGRIGDKAVDYPFVAGHECAGTVEKVGTAVGGIKPGDRVTIDPAIVCGRCDQCRAGRPNTCRRLRYLGTPGELSGALCELIVMPERNCFLLPPELSLEEGALIEPLSISLHALHLTGAPLPTSAAVLGAGPIGLSVLLALRNAGIRTVYATDKIDSRLEAALRAGASWAGNPDREDVVSRMKSLGPAGLDAVYECSGDPSALSQAVEILQPGGRLLVLGIPAEDRVSLDIHALRRKEITVQNVRRQRFRISEAIDLLSKRCLDLRFMATHRFSLEDARLAFELAAGYKDGVLRAIIQP